MRPFAYQRALSAKQAVELSGDPAAVLLAGGTELVAWLKDGLIEPATVVDVTRLPLEAITRTSEALRIGGLARLADVGGSDAVRAVVPALAAAVEGAASPAIRSMGTIAGNLLQRTRCPYYRYPSEAPCNKRRPGSGCAALDGVNRTASILGANDLCVATHPSDLSLVLVAAGATLNVLSAAGSRSVPLAGFHAPNPADPARETTLEPGDLVTEIVVPVAPLTRAIRFVKVRDRAAFDFALVSAAVGLARAGDRIEAATIALGGVAPRPWPCPRAADALAGATYDLDAIRRAIELDLGAARPLSQNGFKVELVLGAALRAAERSWEEAR